MASLRVIPYEYVPTKRQRRSNHPYPSVGKLSGAHRSEQQSEPAFLPQEALQLSIAEVLGDVRGAVEMRRDDGVYETTAGEPARRGIQDLTPILSAELSFGAGAIDQDDFGGATGYSQVEPIESGPIDTDPASDVDSLFGDVDINHFFEEQEVSPAMDDNDSHAIRQHTDTSADPTDNLALENEPTQSDAVGSGSPQFMKRRTNTKRRSQGGSSVILDDSSSSDGGTSDESDCESIFDDRRSKRSKSRISNSSTDSATHHSGTEAASAKLIAHIDSQPKLPPVEVVEQENLLRIDRDGPDELEEVVFDVFAEDNGEDGEDARSMKRRKLSAASCSNSNATSIISELQDGQCNHTHSSRPVVTIVGQSSLKSVPLPEHRHREYITGSDGDDGPTPTIELVNTASFASNVLESTDLGEPQLGALIADPNPDQDWEIRNIIGRKIIDGAVHYWVDWEPTWMCESELGGARELVDKFMARLQAKRGNKGEKRPLKRGRHSIVETDVLGEREQKKRRGRSRKQT